MGGSNPRVVNNLKHDLRYAARQLLKGNGFTFVAVITLALGLSANIMIYTMIDGFFFQPLQVQNADRLVVVTRQNPRAPILQLDLLASIIPAITLTPSTAACAAREPSPTSRVFKTVTITM